MGGRKMSNFNCTFFRSEGPRILASTTLPPEHWKLTIVRGNYVPAKIAKN